MRISDWSSDVCSSDLVAFPEARVLQVREVRHGETVGYGATWIAPRDSRIAITNLGYADGYLRSHAGSGSATWRSRPLPLIGRISMDLTAFDTRSEEHTSELQSLMRISYAVCCLKKKHNTQ